MAFDEYDFIGESPRNGAFFVKSGMCFLRIFWFLRDPLKNYSNKRNHTEVNTGTQTLGRNNVNMSPAMRLSAPNVIDLYCDSSDVVFRHITAPRCLLKAVLCESLATFGQS
jgi:hypothetical protein